MVFYYALYNLFFSFFLISSVAYAQNNIVIKSGFDNGTTPSTEITNTIDWYPIGGTEYLQSNIPIVVAGAVKSSYDSYAVMVRVTISVDRVTKYVQCITWFCSPDENDTNTYSKIVELNVNPYEWSTKKDIVENVELQGSRQGNIILFQGKRVIVKNVRISHEILSVTRLQRAG